MRLRNVRHLDPRQAGLVETAYYTAKAPKGGVNAAKLKKRPPVQVRNWRVGFSCCQKAEL